MRSAHMSYMEKRMGGLDRRWFHRWEKLTCIRVSNDYLLLNDSKKSVATLFLTINVKWRGSILVSQNPWENSVEFSGWFSTSAL